MDIGEINKILRTKAVRAGLCEDWQKNIWNRDLSLDELLMIYIRGIDFSLKQEWFDYDFIKVAFPKDVLHRHHIYIDEKVEIDYAESGTWVFLGNCEGGIRFTGFTVGSVYIRHASDLDIAATDFSKVFVSLYDHGECRTEKFDHSVCKVYDRRKE